MLCLLAATRVLAIALALALAPAPALALALGLAPVSAAWLLLLG